MVLGVTPVGAEEVCRSDGAQGLEGEDEGVKPRSHSNHVCLREKSEEFA